MLLTAVHIDDTEVTNDAVISHVIFNIQQNKVKTKEQMSGCYSVSNIFRELRPIASNFYELAEINNR